MSDKPIPIHGFFMGVYTSHTSGYEMKKIDAAQLLDWDFLFASASPSTKFCVYPKRYARTEAITVQVKYMTPKATRGLLKSSQILNGIYGDEMAT